MKKNYFFAVALVAAALAGCSQDEFADYNPEISSNFTATLETVNSRTTLDANNKVQWVVSEDHVSLFEKVDINAKYQVSSVDDNGTATLTYVSHTEKADYQTLDKYYAVYPYSANNTISATDGKITAPVPAAYTYTDKESCIASALMVARSESKAMTFTNAQGIIRLKLNAETPYTYGKIQSITLTSEADNVYLNGTATMNWNTETPSAVIESGEEANKTLTINLAESLKVNLPSKQGNEYAEYYVPVVPTTFEKDKLEIVVTFENGTYTTTVPAEFNVGRKNIVTLTHTIGSDDFTADIEDVTEAANATQTAVAEENLTVSLGEQNITLDAAYAFTTEETYDERMSSPCCYYNVDYVVSFSKDICNAAVMMFGQFGGGWNYYDLSESGNLFETLSADKEYRLLKDNAENYEYYGSYVDFADKAPKWGVYALTDTELKNVLQQMQEAESENNITVDESAYPSGTIMTVELRLYERVDKGAGSSGLHVYEETGKYSVINTVTYTFD